MGSEIYCGKLTGEISKEKDVLSARFTAENHCSTPFLEWNVHVLIWDYCKETATGAPEMGEMSFGRLATNNAGNWHGFKFRCSVGADKLNWNRYVKQLCRPTSGDMHIPYCDALKSKYKDELNCSGRCETMDNMRFLDWKYY